MKFDLKFIHSIHKQKRCQIKIKTKFSRYVPDDGDAAVQAKAVGAAPSLPWRRQQAPAQYSTAECEGVASVEKLAGEVQTAEAVVARSSAATKTAA